jgi:hypothetical protein
VKVFYDPRFSVRGALLSAARNPPRPKDPSDYAAVGEIFTPISLPMYRVSTVLFFTLSHTDM